VACAGRTLSVNPIKEFDMNRISKTLMCACIALAAGGSFAQDAMKPDGAANKDHMMKKEMTMQDCKDHMAMAKKEGTKKDSAAMKMDAKCADMMKKGGAASEPSMQK
jgi:hypothetical protein